MDLKPASKGTEESYDPQATTMQHDSVFASIAPGVVSSGNLKYKWGAPEAHTKIIAPSENLEGD